MTDANKRRAIAADARGIGVMRATDQPVTLGIAGRADPPPVPLKPLFRQACHETERGQGSHGLLVVLLSAAQRRPRDEQQEAVRELQRLNEALRVENVERKRADENMRRTERELRLIVDTVPALAARYRPDGTMDFRNKAWRDYTGLSQDNLEDKRWGSALHPDDLALVEREWRSHIATGEPFELEQRLRRADGVYRWHWVRRVPLHDDSGKVIKWYGVAFDIEDRRLAEEAQRRSEAALCAARRELQLTIDSIPVMVSTFDPDGTRSFVNQQWQNYTDRKSVV